MSKLLLALVETSRDPYPERSLDSLQRVLDRNRRLLREAIVFLPENWLSREPIDEHVYLDIVDNLYKTFGYTIFVGLSYINLGGSVRSRGYAVVDGKVEVVCEKVFPSKAVGERGRIKSGEPGRVVDVHGVKIGCIACVDIFYPELSRRLVVRGAQILYNPAAIPSDRLELWWSILRSRAAENIAYTVGVNSVGVEYPDGRFTGGGSRVYSPSGIMLEPVVENGVLLYEIDLSELDRVRERWAFRDDLESGLGKLYIK
ncbi:MAG: carbon-nitrogen hydrolase family protein [Desulfurococcales archaeon]|nr:carbon-nitrogen hydrolase family protein [Desulfurococcales archaeon]